MPSTWRRLSSCVLRSGYLKADEVASQRNMGLNDEQGGKYCDMSSHSTANMGGMVSMDSLCNGKAICLQSPGIQHNMIKRLPRQSRLQKITAFRAQQPPQPPHTHPPCIDRVYALIERSYVSGHWHYSRMTSPTPNNGTPHALHVFKYWFAHHPLQSHKGSLRKELDKKKKERETGRQGLSSCHTETPPQKEVWQLFNFGKKSNGI